MSRPLRFNASRETVHLDEDLLASCYRCQLLTHTPTRCQARSHLTRCCVKYFNQSFGCFNLFGEFDLLLLQIRPLWLPQCLLITSIGKYWTNLFGLVQCKNRCWPTCWKHLQTMTWMLLWTNPKVNNVSQPNKKKSSSGCAVVGVLGDVESYSGFLRVDADLGRDSQLFFWFVPRQKSPASGDTYIYMLICHQASSSSSW